ncbi:helix-turn-helix transcriptional regulator [Aquipuribacter nitratireducens]|uniref:Helix-turn-helix transcriptional regulator n=1 Tax=Aquipuribacter nitratireducens TaxID=650104 RepID=A0ABW0GSI8_9MICO
MTAAARPAGGVARYASRLAHVPRALQLLRHHPDGLPISDLAADLDVHEAQLREELEVFFLADVVDAGAVGLRSCALEFLAPTGDGALAETDLASAQVVRLVDDSPLQELGVAFLSPGELGVLYRAASELSALEPDNAALAAAVRRLGDGVLGGVDGLAEAGDDAGDGARDGARDGATAPPLLGGAVLVGADVAADLRRAATAQRRVRIVYARAWRPGVVERVVEPYRVVSTRRGYEVDAGPLDADGQPRTYLVSGIRDHEVLPDTFERPADADERVAAARRPTRVRLVLPADRAWVVERFAEDVRLEAADEDGVLLVAEVLPPVRERVGLLLAVAGAGAFVLDPPGLAEADREVAARLLEHHRLT